MKHCLFLLNLLFISGSLCYSQLTNNGATIKIQPGAYIFCSGDVLNQSGGTISNDGKLEVQGNFTNSATYTTATGDDSLIMSGNTNVTLTPGGSTLNYLVIGKSLNSNTVTLGGGATIGVNLLFTGGKMLLSSFDFTLASSATITGYDNQKYIVTNSSGQLIKNSLGASPFVFPVGADVSTYNPLTMTQNGTADNMGVRCLVNVLDQGLTGSPVTQDFANNSWVITEAVAGGSNLSLTSQWVGTDELSNFNRLKSGIARYNTGTDWDLPASNVIAASGSDPYTRTRSGITTTGVFAVADLDRVNTAKLNLKIFLQGCYSGGSMMNDALRVANVIPVTQPYSSSISARFTRVGIYDGTVVNETVPSTSVFDVTGTNDDIVDWVYVALLDPVTPTTKLQTRAALLQRDGDVVEYDAGTSTYIPLRMPIDADGNYHVLIGHRNHLSIRTASPLLLQDNVTTNYDFTTAQSQAYQDGTITSNAAMKDLGGGPGPFGLWGGNVNANSNIRYAGPSNDNSALLTILGGNTTTVLSSVYSLGDINMNGIVRYSGPSNDNSFLLSIIGGNTTVVLTEHL